MYRVIGTDGISYTANDLATLQQWVNEGRVQPGTQIDDVVTDRRISASEVVGLTFPQFREPPSVQATYPRAAGAELVNPPIIKAALTTAFCCLPFGIVAIVYASQASSHVARGDIIAAQDACKKSHMWANIAIGVYLVAMPLYIVAMILLGVFTS